MPEAPNRKAEIRARLESFRGNGGAHLQIIRTYIDDVDYLLGQNDRLETLSTAARDMIRSLRCELATAVVSILSYEQGVANLPQITRLLGHKEDEAKGPEEWLRDFAEAVKNDKERQIH